MSGLLKESMQEVAEDAKDINNPKYIEHLLYLQQVEGHQVGLEANRIVKQPLSNPNPPIQHW